MKVPVLFSLVLKLRGVMSERLDAPALRAVVLLSAVPFRVQIKRVESRDRERGRKERGGG